VNVVIGLFIFLILVAYLMPDALGTIANATSGNAMKNVSTGALNLWELIPLVAVLAFFIYIIRSAVGS
jgi:hypothetical protein